MKSRLILCGLALALAGAARAAYTPIAIDPTNYNADVIVEQNARPNLSVCTTASVDNGTNNTANTWMEIGFDPANPTFGLPPAGTVIVALSNANYSFQMPPSYQVPNGILIDTVVTQGVFTLTTPATYTLLSFLGSGGNGGDVIAVRVNHQDGTFETGTFGCPDWFSVDSRTAVIANERCNSTVNFGYANIGGGFPRLYFRDITLTNTTSAVTNLVLSYSSGAANSHNDVVALSGATTLGGAVSPIIVTGYTYDFVVEATASKRGRVLSQTIVGGTNAWATSQTMDNTGNTGNVWYEQGYNTNNFQGFSTPSPTQNTTGTGLPHPSGFVTNAALDHIYQMPPDYTTNDAVYVSTAITNTTITLTTPAIYSALSFLTSAGNGPVNPVIIVNHQDGTSETNSYTVIYDWFNTAAPIAFKARGRVAVDTAQLDVRNDGTLTPQLDQSDFIVVNTASPVTSITLNYTNAAGRMAIFGLSGTTGPVPPIISSQPVSTNQYVGANVSFSAAAVANVAITSYKWQKGTNNVFINLSDGGNIAGSSTPNLSINNIGFADAANYQLVATDSAGTTTSFAATLGVFSTVPDVTQPGDPITGVNITPFGDGSPAFAIDNTMSTKFGANISGGVPALVISPAAGRTVLSALRIYTGSDTTSRDPASYKLEGSVDGGSTYTLISSNSIVLSNNRNPLVAVPPDPLSQFVTEVRFSNANGYTTYKLSFPTQKGSGSVQFDEMELLGTNDTSKPFFSAQPTDQKAFNGNSASFTANAVYTPAPTISWRKGTNGVYVPLTDVGNISGSQTTSLSVNPATFADVADYIAIANSTAGFVTSSIAHLYIYSTNTTVAQASDTITGFGDTTGAYHAPNNDPAYVIDGTFTEWINGGSGLSASANFPPFGGPVGMILTPSVGTTVLVGLRVYPGLDTSDADPNGFILEGSNNGGASYTTIASGSLSVPLTRNTINLPVDPVNAWAQEVLFPNTHGYTSYRLTFPDVRTASAASFLEVGEVEFLGVPAAVPFAISSTTLSGGNLNISGTGGTPSGSFTVITNGNLTAPVASWGAATTGTFDSSGNFSISLPVNASNPRLFYLIKTP